MEGSGFPIQERIRDNFMDKGAYTADVGIAGQGLQGGGNLGRSYVSPGRAEA